MVMLKAPALIKAPLYTFFITRVEVPLVEELVPESEAKL